MNLLSAKMPGHFWSYSLRYVITVHNKTPNSAINFKTPYKLLLDKPPKVKSLRRFGCAASLFDVNAMRKFNPQGKLAFILECDDTGYTVFKPKLKTIIKSRNVRAYESRVYGDFIGTNTYLPSDSKVIFDKSEKPTMSESVKENEVDPDEIILNEHPGTENKTSNTEQLGEYIFRM